MKRKSSLPLAAFGTFQSLYGLAGSLLFMASLDLVSFTSFYLIETPIKNVYTVGIDFVKLTVGIFYCLSTFPFVLLFICGAGIIARRRWARKLTIVGLPFLLAMIYSVAYAVFTLAPQAVPLRSFLVTIAPLTFFCVCAIIVLTRASLKQQFV